jgi:RNA polymerase sigma factor (TIGR02999 family)
MSKSAEAVASEIEALLADWRAGKSSARDALVTLIYPALKDLAHRQRRGQAQLTLKTTDLAHEAYLRVFDKSAVDWQSQGHFVAILSNAIRHVIVDHFRAKQTEKRGANVEFVSLDEKIDSEANENMSWLALNDALEAYQRLDPTGAKVVELTYFGGLNAEQVAVVMHSSIATVGRQLRFARAWLQSHVH